MSVSKSAQPAAASSVRTGDTDLFSFAGSAEGGLPALEPAALEPAKNFLGPGMASFAAGSGLLLPGVAAFAPPLARFTLLPGVAAFAPPLARFHAAS
jgi:hypothetical protein